MGEPGGPYPCREDRGYKTLCRSVIEVGGRSGLRGGWRWASQAQSFLSQITTPSYTVPHTRDRLLTIFENLPPGGRPTRAMVPGAYREGPSRAGAAAAAAAPPAPHELRIGPPQCPYGIDGRATSRALILYFAARTIAARLHAPNKRPPNETDNLNESVNEEMRQSRDEVLTDALRVFGAAHCDPSPVSSRRPT